MDPGMSMGRSIETTGNDSFSTAGDVVVFDSQHKPYHDDNVGTRSAGNASCYCLIDQMQIKQHLLDFGNIFVSFNFYVERRI